MCCRFSDFLDEIWTMYELQDPSGEGVSTGWRDLDNYYRVRISAERKAVHV